MENVILKRGNDTISLKKSKNLIAVKTNKNEEVSKTLSSMVLETPWKDTGKNLNGFRLVKINSEENTELMESALDQIRESELINAGSHVYNIQEEDVPYVPSGKITLRFQPNTTTDQKNAILDEYHLTVLSSRVKKNTDGSTTETYITGITPNSPNPLKVAVELQQKSEVIQLAEPDLITPAQLKTFVIPTDEYFKEQWHLKNTGIYQGTSLAMKAGADARVVAAWEATGSLGSPSVIVAVIDDGFDLTHPDLNGDSKIIAPWNFEKKNNDPSPSLADDFHGTACAGVAIGNANGSGIVGAAPGCRLMPVRWDRSLSDDSIEAWFNYVTTNGAWVVSCSWGAASSNFSLSTRQIEAIEDCAKEGRNGLGCVVVFAAGNSNHDINDPGGYTKDGFAIHPDVICVAASSSRDQRAHYSNFGKEVSICAPSSSSGGRGILTADVRNFTIGNTTYYGYDLTDYTWEFGGTSSATPLVAGICALLLSLDPGLSSKQVKEIIQKTARKIGDNDQYINGHSNQFGYGCINAEAAVSHVLQSRSNIGIKSTSPSLFTQEWWGTERHELVGAVADKLLNDKAKSAIKALLAPIGNTTLKDIAAWADQIKGTTPGPNLDSHTNDFLTKFEQKEHKSWHYVDFPLGAEGYDSEKYPEFARENDIVQILKKSIKVLQGQSDFMTPINALRWLVHLTGDIHQPLHVGCSYIDESDGTPKLVFDPAKILEVNAKDDQGGNRLILPINSKPTLHSYWDSQIPEAKPNHNGQPLERNINLKEEFEFSFSSEDDFEKDVYIQKLLTLIQNQPKVITALTDAAVLNNSTDSNTLAESDENIHVDHLPEEWASKTLLTARQAYETLKIEKKLANNKYQVTWEGKAHYDARCAPLVSRQLAMAAQHLAIVVNAIFG